MIGLKSISPQMLSDTIGPIYDCALDPQRWIDAIHRIDALSDSAAGGMCVHDLKDVQNVRLFEVGYTKECSDTVQKHYEQSPFATAACVADVGDVWSLAMDPDEKLTESRFYREAMEPFGIVDAICFMALRTGGRVASVHASRTGSAPLYGERDFAILKLLAPHVCRTLTISDALDIRTLRSEILEATLDGLAAGVYLIRRDGRVVYMNTAAERQVKAANALRIVNNRLLPTNAKARAAIAKAIDEVATDETDAGTTGHSLAISGADGAGYIATLLPLERGRRQSIMAPFAASIAVFAQDRAHVPLMPGEAFAKLYRLTGGELRVLLALAQGLGANESADMLGISESTVRTHLQRMFAKTGTSRQAELLQLLQASTPPTRAA